MIINCQTPTLNPPPLGGEGVFSVETKIWIHTIYDNQLAIYATFLTTMVYT